MLRRRGNETNKRISNLTSNVLLLKRDVQLQAGRERLMIERLQRERERLMVEICRANCSRRCRG